MLFIVATPIGNLDDFSKRAVDTLASCDAILCEDTRRSSILLNRYQIQKPLISYHKFKEKASLEKILLDLQSGQNLALISDAGTPCINDPGQILVQACIEKGIEITAIPGACSVIQALVLSGFDTSSFQFIGFLPKTGQSTLKRALHYPGTTVCFESPERLISTLEEILALDPKRELAVARELTKTYEECRRGKPSELISHFQTRPPKGEIVLLIKEGDAFDDDLSLEELVKMLQDLHGLSLKEAVKTSAKMKNMPKRDVYNQFFKKMDELC